MYSEILESNNYTLLSCIKSPNRNGYELETECSICKSPLNFNSGRMGKLMKRGWLPIVTGKQIGRAHV